jgi:hypothetical protein
MRRRSYEFPVRVKINIVDDDIVNAIPGDPEGCTIWRAVMLRGEGFKHQPSRCRVMGSRMSVKIADKRAYYSFSRNGTSVEAATDIVGGAIRPGVIVVERLSEPKKVAALSERKRTQNNSSRTKVRNIAAGVNVKGNGGGRTYAVQPSKV